MCWNPTQKSKVWCLSSCAEFLHFGNDFVSSATSECPCWKLRKLSMCCIKTLDLVFVYVPPIVFKTQPVNIWFHSSGVYIQRLLERILQIVVILNSSFIFSFQEQLYYNQQYKSNTVYVRDCWIVFQQKYDIHPIRLAETVR